MFALPRTIVWGDSPELAAAAFSLGNPHPTGYSLYMLLLHAFQWLPLGSIAFRSHLFSAVCMSSACSIWVIVLLRFLSSTPSFSVWNGMVSAFTAVTAFAFTPITWSQAIITEVYAFFILLCVLHVFIVQLAWHKPWQYMLPFLLMTTCQLIHHRLSLFLTAILVLIWVYSCIKHFDRKPSAASIIIQCVLGISPILLLLYFPIRASYTPFINWYNPDSPARFFAYINGEMYQTILQNGITNARYIFTSSEIMNHVLFTYNAYGWLGLFIAFGWWMLIRSQWRLGVIALVLYLVYLLFLMLYKVGDWQVFMLPVLLIQTVPLAFGILQLLDWISSAAKKYFTYSAYGVCMVLACLPLFVPNDPVLFHIGLWRAFNQRELQNRFAMSRDHSAVEYANQVWEIAQAGDAVITGLDRNTADNEYFPLLYQHVVEQKGMESPLIGANFLRYDWYRKQLNERYGLSLPMTGDRLYYLREDWLNDIWIELIEPLLQRGGVVTPSPNLAGTWYNDADIQDYEIRIPRAVVPQSYLQRLPGTYVQRLTRKTQQTESETP